MLILRVIGFTSALAVVTAAWMLPAAPPRLSATEEAPPFATPVETLYAINIFDAEAACCAGGANGGADPTGNECTRLDDVAVEFVNGRRVVGFALGKRLPPPVAGGTIALESISDVTR